MHISKREIITLVRRAATALVLVLCACYSAKVDAQVPVQIQSSESGNYPSILYSSSELTPGNYNSTDFTFDLSDLSNLTVNDGGKDDDKHTIKCQKTTDLSFGRAFSGISTGTVIMDPNTSISRQSTGGVILDDRDRGHPAHIQLTIYNTQHCETDDHDNNDDNECGRSEDDDNKQNDDRSAFTRHGVWNTISFPSSSTLSLTLGGHTYTMTADTYKFIRTNGDFYIGATLHVGANQVSGVYTGTFTVTQTCD